MRQFIQKYEEKIRGTLSGWDRIVFRGTLRRLCFVDGMMGYVAPVGVLLKDFGEHAQATTARLIEASLAAAEDAARPIHYLESAQSTPLAVSVEGLHPHISVDRGPVGQVPRFDRNERESS